MTSLLRVKDFSEDQLRQWLEGFGQIEEVFLLRDVVPRQIAPGVVLPISFSSE